MIRKFVNLIHRLETDSTWQFNFHGAMTAIWIFGILTVPAFFWPRYPEAWAQLFLLEISLWANAMTHFGALSSALAAIHTEELEKTEKGPGEADMWFDESAQISDSEFDDVRRRFLDRDPDPYNFTKTLLERSFPLSDPSPEQRDDNREDWDIEDELINAVDDKPLKVRSDVSHLSS